MSRSLVTCHAKQTASFAGMFGAFLIIQSRIDSCSSRAAAPLHDVKGIVNCGSAAKKRNTSSDLCVSTYKIVHEPERNACKISTEETLSLVATLGANTNFCSAVRLRSIPSQGSAATRTDMRSSPIEKRAEIRISGSSVVAVPSRSSVPGTNSRPEHGATGMRGAPDIFAWARRTAI